VTPFLVLAAMLVVWLRLRQRTPAAPT